MSQPCNKCGQAVEHAFCPRCGAPAPSPTSAAGSAGATDFFAAQPVLYSADEVRQRMARQAEGSTRQPPVPAKKAVPPVAAAAAILVALVIAGFGFMAATSPGGIDLAAMRREVMPPSAPQDPPVPTVSATPSPVESVSSGVCLDLSGDSVACSSARAYYSVTRLAGGPNDCTPQETFSGRGDGTHGACSVPLHAAPSASVGGPLAVGSCVAADQESSQVPCTDRSAAFKITQESSDYGKSCFEGGADAVLPAGGKSFCLSRIAG